MTKFPRLLDKDGKLDRLLYPISASVSERLTPLSVASMELPDGESIEPRAYVEMFTPLGSVGVYRVRSPQQGIGSTASVELEHAVTELGDYLVREKISGMMAANTAVKKIFDYYDGKLWKLGKIADIGSGQVAVDVNYDGVLDALLSILKQKTDCMMTFDFSSTPWKVGFAKKGTAIAAEGRLSRNVKSARITYDDSELCTRVYYDKTGKDKWTYKDASAAIKNKYGMVQRTVGTNSNMTDAEITQKVNTYLAEHQEPKVSIEIDGVDLADITDEDFDKFVVGAKCRLALPDYGMTVTNTITAVNWQDVYNDPRSMTVVLGNEADTVVNFIHENRSGGGGGKRKKDEDEKWKEYTTKISQTDKDIELWAKQTDKANNILQKAGIKISANGVITYAVNKKNGNYITSFINQKADSITQTITDAKKELKSEIKQERDRISLVVTGTGKKAKIDAASIVLGINSQKDKPGESYVRIKATTINLEGYVTASQLSATDAKIENLLSGTTLAGSIRANQLSGGSFKMNGQAHHNSNITIEGQTYNIVTWG